MKPTKYEGRTTSPLAQCLKPEALVRLIEYQWEHHGQKLEILREPWGQPDYSNATGELESQEEIVKLMKQKPHSPRQVA